MCPEFFGWAYRVCKTNGATQNGNRPICTPLNEPKKTRVQEDRGKEKLRGETLTIESALFTTKEAGEYYLYSVNPLSFIENFPLFIVGKGKCGRNMKTNRFN